MKSHTAIRRLVAASGTVVVALATTTAAAGAAPPARPASAANCLATVTVAETQIEPGFVGRELRRIVALGPAALPTLAHTLTGQHLGDFEACAALVGE